MPQCRVHTEGDNPDLAMEKIITITRFCCCCAADLAGDEEGKGKKSVEDVEPPTDKDDKRKIRVKFVNAEFSLYDDYGYRCVHLRLMLYMIHVTYFVPLLLIQRLYAAPSHLVCIESGCRQSGKIASTKWRGSGHFGRIRESCDTFMPQQRRKQRDVNDDVSDILEHLSDHCSHVSNVTATEDVSYCSSPYLPACVRQVQTPFKSNACEWP
jgi:hypothetical protein